MASFDSAAFDTQAFDTQAWDIEEIIAVVQQILYLATNGSYTQIELEKVALLNSVTEFFDENGERDVYLASGSDYTKLDV